MRANLATLVDEFRLHAADTAVVAHRGNRAYRTSYGDLATLTGRFSAELDRRGIAPGERVVLWGTNSAEWIAAFFGCVLRAVIAVPLDAAGSPEFAARVIRDTAPRLIVGDPQLLAQLQGTGNREKGTKVEGLGRREQGTENAASQTDSPLFPYHCSLFSDSCSMSFATLVESLPAEPLFTPSAAIQPHTPFQIVFTSGTTSEPRGIVHTHRNILVSLQPIEDEMQKYLRYERYVHPLRFLHLLPLSHVFGQFMGLWCPALLGAEVHFAEEFEPARLIQLMKRERISVLIAVPRVLALLRTHLLTRFPELQGTGNREQGAGKSSELSDVSSQKNQLRGILKKWWRFRRIHRALGWKFWAVISGGATLPAELETFWNRLGFALIQGYGMTETAALVTLNHPFHIKEGSIGRPLPGRDVQISADGEILVRGDMLTEATWQGGAMRKREGEWLATGDLAETSASGELKFLGRKGDVIVTSAGLNIHPADLETALTAQPGIRVATVVACDLNAGPEPVAVVLSTLSGAEIQAAVDGANRTLAEFQQIRRVLCWPELQFPTTSTGKLLRREISAWACATLTGNRAEAIAPSRDSLLAVIAEVTGEPIPVGTRPPGLKPSALGAVDGAAKAVPLTEREADGGLSGRLAGNNLYETEDSLRLSEDLHLDSLGRVQLQSALEQRFSLELEDDAIAAVATVGDLRALVELSVGSSQLSVERQLPVPSKPNATSNPQPLTVSQLTTANRELTTQHLYPHWPWSGPIQLLRTAWIELIMRPLVWLLANPRVTLAAPLEPRTSNLEPVLLISNHITAYDGAFILYALPRHLRHHIAAAMSGEMLLDYRQRRNQGNWFLNTLAPAAYYLLTALFNVFPLPRARGFRRSFAHAGEAMDHGYSVLIFPEGTRSRIGRMNPFRPGIGLLAQQSRVPILPIALVGLYDPTLEPRTPNLEPKKWFHSGNIEIRIGEIIPAPAEDTDPATLTTQLEQALHSLLADPEQLPKL